MRLQTKKILIVFNSLNIGGIETKIIDLCQYFSQQKDIKLFLVLKNNTGSLLPQIPKNVNVIFPQITSILKIKTILFPFWLFIPITKIKPDLTIAFGNYSSVSTIIAKVISHSHTKVVISEDSSIIEQIHADKFSFIRKQLVIITYPLSNQIIVLSQSGKDKLKTLIPNIHNQKLIILPNWLPLNYKPYKNNQPRDIDLLFLGRFEPQKNPLMFLEISKNLLKIHPHLKISLVGYGSLEDKIHNYISKYQLQNNITVHPATTNCQLYFYQSKFFILTSDHEGFPLTLLESTASGCIPICHKLPEINKYLSYQSKYVLFSSQSECIYNINYLISNPNLINNISHYYQQKTLENQKINFQNTINTLIKFL